MENRYFVSEDGILYDDDDGIPYLPDGVTFETPEAQGANHGPTEVHEPAKCVACDDTVSLNDEYAGMKVSCGHIFCRDCLRRLFQAACTDESSFPPRCCEPIDPSPGLTARDAAAGHRLAVVLGEEITNQYITKREEFTSNRVYCAAPACSAFVPTRCIKNNIATCDDCKATTCALCKAASHEGSCRESREARELAQLAETEGWKTCEDCGRVISLAWGCNHMTCHCGNQFCYLCGKRWKTCGCPQYNERQNFGGGPNFWEPQLYRRACREGLGRMYGEQMRARALAIDGKGLELRRPPWADAAHELPFEEFDQRRAEGVRQPAQPDPQPDFAARGAQNNMAPMREAQREQDRPYRPRRRPTFEPWMNNEHTSLVALPTPLPRPDPRLFGSGGIDAEMAENTIAQVPKQTRQNLHQSRRDRTDVPPTTPARPRCLHDQGFREELRQPGTNTTCGRCGRFQKVSIMVCNGCNIRVCATCQRERLAHGRKRIAPRAGWGSWV